jgi:hypothetical protein
MCVVAVVVVTSMGVAGQQGKQKIIALNQQYDCLFHHEHSWCHELLVKIPYLHH